MMGVTGSTKLAAQVRLRVTRNELPLPPIVSAGQRVDVR
jgi:hypothetical protein